MSKTKIIIKDAVGTIRAVYVFEDDLYPQVPLTEEQFKTLQLATKIVCGYCNGNYPQYHKEVDGPNSAGNYFHYEKDNPNRSIKLCQANGIFAYIAYHGKNNETSRTEVRIPHVPRDCEGLQKLGVPKERP